ncbi:MAG: hypothetical protein JW827_09970 [Spirochaetes bacterium]|nr:hypothetical protein [Spirochaetota bacterium]
MFKTIIARIRFYVFLLGAFLGIEIPLIIFTYFKIFPRYRNLIWIITLLIGLGSAYIVHYMIRGIINEDYRLKILFDNPDGKGEQDEET